MLAQQPELIGQLDDALSPLDLADGLEPDWPRQIRRWRRAQSVKLIWRDISGRDNVEQTLQGSTWIAEQALSQTFNALLQGMQQVHDVGRADSGTYRASRSRTSETRSPGSCHTSTSHCSPSVFVHTTMYRRSMRVARRMAGTLA